MANCFQILLFLHFTIKLFGYEIIKAIDCGATSDSYKASNQIHYQEDQYFSSNSREVDYSLNEDLKNIVIKYTKDTRLYQTERHAEESFHYDIPIDEPGIYTIVLKFSESYFNESNERVFDIKVGDRVILRNFDIVKEGKEKFAAVNKYFEFEITSDDEVFVEDELCQNAYIYPHKTLKIEFQKGKADNPKIDAIVIFKGRLNESDYEEQQNLEKNWDQYLLELDEVARKKKEQEDLEYWGPPPEPFFCFFCSFKFLAMLLSLSFFIWLVIELDKLPDLPESTDNKIKVDLNAAGKPAEKKEAKEF